MYSNALSIFTWKVITFIDCTSFYRNLVSPMSEHFVFLLWQNYFSRQNPCWITQNVLANFWSPFLTKINEKAMWLLERKFVNLLSKEKWKKRKKKSTHFHFRFHDSKFVSFSSKTHIKSTSENVNSVTFLFIYLFIYWKSVTH